MTKKGIAKEISRIEATWMIQLLHPGDSFLSRPTGNVPEANDNMAAIIFRDVIPKLEAGCFEILVQTIAHCLLLQTNSCHFLPPFRFGLKRRTRWKMPLAISVQPFFWFWCLVMQCGMQVGGRTAKLTNPLLFWDASKLERLCIFCQFCPFTLLTLTPVQKESAWDVIHACATHFLFWLATCPYCGTHRASPKMLLSSFVREFGYREFDSLHMQQALDAVVMLRARRRSAAISALFLHLSRTLKD